MAKWLWWLTGCVVCLVMLAGCNGGSNMTGPEAMDDRLMASSPTHPSDDTSDAEIQTNPFRSYGIVAIGDSITYGTGSSTPGAGYPKMLETTMRNAGYTATVWNEGIPGASTSNFESLFYWYVGDADIVLIMLGANDIMSPTSCQDPGSRYTCNTLGDLRSMANKALAAGMVPVLATVTPKRAGDVLESWNPRIQELNAQIILIANELDVPVADPYTAILSHGGNALFSDKHHFTDQGYQVIADEFYRVLTEDVVYGNF